MCDWVFTLDKNDKHTPFSRRVEIRHSRHDNHRNDTCQSQNKRPVHFHHQTTSQKSLNDICLGLSETNSDWETRTIKSQF